MLSGSELDFWVAKANGMDAFEVPYEGSAFVWCFVTVDIDLRHSELTVHSCDDFRPSQFFSHGGPIIEEQGICTAKDDTGGWNACLDAKGEKLYHGETFLQAAMRCFVGTKFPGKE